MSVVVSFWGASALAGTIMQLCEHAVLLRVCEGEYILSSPLHGNVSSLQSPNKEISESSSHAAAASTRNTMQAQTLSGPPENEDL